MKSKKRIKKERKSINKRIKALDKNRFENYSLESADFAAAQDAVNDLRAIRDTLDWVLGKINFG